MDNKKGAIEMSMTTIIVIVLGVTLLILGLVFVQFIFKKTTELAEGAFERAEGKISDFSQISKELTISPERIDLEKGNTKIVSVTIANFKEKNINAKLTVSTKSKDDDLICLFEETESDESDDHPLPSGEFRTLNLRIESKDDGTIGNKVCKIVASGLGEGIQDTISIKVVA